MPQPDSPLAPAPDTEPPVREVGLAEVLQMAQQLQREQRLDEAEDIYLQVLRQLPDEPNALHFFGVLRHQQGKTNDALVLLSEAIKHLPDAPGPWLNLANVLIEAGHTDDAVKALQQVIALAPDWVMAYNNLGILHTRLGHWEQAEAALLQAVAKAPKAAYPHYNLAALYFRTGRLRECAAASLASQGLDQSGPKGHLLLSRSLVLMGDTAGARAALQDWLAQAPADPEAQHHLAALDKQAVPARASDAYVQQLFDRFANSFEGQLQTLGYQAPQHVAASLQALQHLLPAQAVLLDAGCGTGLCGPLLRPLAARLEGVDLSEGMLQRARARGDYDQLHKAELGAFLAGQPAGFDAIASADVLVYFGALDTVFQGFHSALRPGGLLVATLEAADETGDPAALAAGYHLAIHGRYSHTARYIQDTLARAGLQLLGMEAQTLRRELHEDVRGWLLSARKALLVDSANAAGTLDLATPTG